MPKNFRCADNDFEQLCKEKDSGVENYIENFQKEDL